MTNFNNLLLTKMNKDAMIIFQMKKGVSSFKLKQYPFSLFKLVYCYLRNNHALVILKIVINKKARSTLLKANT